MHKALVDVLGSTSNILAISESVSFLAGAGRLFLIDGAPGFSSLYKVALANPSASHNL